MSRPEVTIIGAGFVGMCCAMHLLQDGYRVVVVDRDEPGNACSYGNGGQFVAGWSAPMAMPGVLWRVPGWLLSPMAPLSIRWRYLPRLMPWLAQMVRASAPARVEAIARALWALNRDPLSDLGPLLAAAGATDLVHPGGRLDVFRSPRALAAAASRYALLGEHGMRVEPLDAAGVVRVEPALAGVGCGGFHLPETQWTSNPQGLTRRFAEHAQRHGATLLRREVRGLTVHDARVVELHTDDGALAVERLVLAAGAYSRPLARALGCDVPLDTQRGYHVTLPHVRLPISRPVSVQDLHFAMTPMHDGLRVGGIAEFAGVAAPMNPRNVAKLAHGFGAAFPTLDASDGVPWMGCRPAFPDSLPVIGAAPGVHNAWLAFGHGHHGMGGGARTGRLVAELVGGRPAVIDPHPYRAQRFAS